MSLSNQSNPNISLQKPSSVPPKLPATDEFGRLLPQLLSEPRACRAGWGLSWFIKAFSIFKEQFLLWLGIGVTYLIIAMIGGNIPIINFVFPFISMVFIGGIIIGANAQATGRELRFDHLFAAFNTHLVPLIILFLLYLVVLVIAIIPLAVVFGGMALAMGQPSSGATVGLVVGVLLALLLFLPALMVIWFSPALIVLHNIAPVEAMKMSFRGCLRNIFPFLVFLLIVPIIAVIITAFTLGLGLLVLFPVGMITYYTSYRDVWTDQPLSAL